MDRRIFVTIDQDWACDEVLKDTSELIDELNIPVTLFVTNDTPMLNELRKNPLFRLGIHPNFLPQLNGQSKMPFRAVLEEMRDLVPEAEDLRCHAIVDATPILVTAHEMGFLRDFNLFLPYSSGMVLKPFRHFGGLTRIPYFYEDDAYCFEAEPAEPAEHLLKNEGLKVFNFHPIHLFLNTEAMDRYDRAKPFYHDFERLRPFVNPGTECGARSFLKRLVRDAKELGYEFVSTEAL